MRWFVFVVLAGCSTSSPTEPAPQETFTMDTAPAITTKPIDDGTAEALPFGPSPWSGKLAPVTHNYWNGCTDHREVDILALKVDKYPVPIIIGWRQATPRSREEPHFLAKRDELPENARRSSCVIVTGSVVTYAYEGIAGAPAYAIQASHIEPCP
jgi:hypothetical protein